MQPLVKVSWDGGVRFTADIRGHKVHVDQPRQGGGEDTAAAPLELLPASLGTCVAYFVQQFLATRGIDPTGLEVDVGVMGAANPHRIGRFDVRVSAGALPRRPEARRRDVHGAPHPDAHAGDRRDAGGGCAGLRADRGAPPGATARTRRRR
jgi:uncharacterized OsmC-like protein